MSGAAGFGESKEESEQRELDNLDLAMDPEPDAFARMRRLVKDERLAAAMAQEQIGEQARERSWSEPHAAAASSSSSGLAPVRRPLSQPEHEMSESRGVYAHAGSGLDVGVPVAVEFSHEDEEKLDPDQEWLEHVNAYPSDRAAEAMLAGLKSDYGFLAHALSDLKHRLHTILSKPTAQGGLGWNYFGLMARGSVITQTALQGGADLDVDLIVPRELRKWRIEGIAEHAMTDAGCVELWTSFQEKIQKLWNAIVKPNAVAASAAASSADFTPKDGQTADSCTRSITLVTWINNTPIDVDLFVKLTDEHVGATVKKVRGGPARRWESVPYSLPIVSSKHWTDEQHLAVLLIKLWKAKHKARITKQIERLEQLEQRSDAQVTELVSLQSDLKAASFPKGYHLNLAMNYLAARELPRTQRAVHKGMCSTR